MFATFTEFSSKKMNRNTDKETNQEEDRPPSTCHGSDLFAPVEPIKRKNDMDQQDNGVQEANPFDGETLKLRFQEMNEHK